MIKETIKIGDKDVEFACSASTLLRYKDQFGEDLLMRMQEMTSDNPNIEVMVNLAYIMAKQAGADEDNMYTWLDQFEMLDFMKALPDITKLWGRNNATTSEAKKK